jgi:hypothetical protein
MDLMERADIWLHQHGLRWLARFLGICHLMVQRLNAPERRR